MLSGEKHVVVLHYTENNTHLICCETLSDCKVLLAGAKAHNEETFTMQIMGMDALIITNFSWVPMDAEIVKQIIRSYIGLMGYQGQHLYAENTLLTALEDLS